MSALTFRLRETPARPVDLSPLTPTRLAGMALEEIRSLPLASGNAHVAVGELFEVSGGELASLRIEGGSALLDGIGAAMHSGTLSVTGDVGAYLGRDMRGGAIRVHGNAGPWAGTGLSGGLVEIDGDAGDFLGAAIAGERRGMRGGTILVRGNAGQRAGDRMRRGMVVIEGNAGEHCGTRMGAGTLCVLGQAGAFTGFGMQRGTLLLTRSPADLPATFNDCGVHELLFLRLLLQDLARLDSRLLALEESFQRVRRYAGDLGCGGKGEVLVAEV
jgi:formylmethanofuran dehydrogenase subunit C